MMRSPIAAHLLLIIVVASASAFVAPTSSLLLLGRGGRRGGLVVGSSTENTRRTSVTALSNNAKYSEDLRTLSSTLLSLSDLSPEAKQTFLRNVYEELGKQQFLLGVHESVTKSLLAHPKEVLTMLWDGYGTLFDYAVDKEIFREAEQMGGLRYLENKALLAVIQQADLLLDTDTSSTGGRHRVDEMLAEEEEQAKKRILEKFPVDDARRYVKFAVAAYGDNGIRSSKLDTEQTFDWRLGDFTSTLVSQHTGIPEEDLILFDVAYDGDPTHLRHFVAVDRGNRKVVLAIRGTYTNREVMIDFNGYSREFLGGEAHAAMSIMTERLWAKIGDQIVELLDENPGFELIVAGHSLGGGCTCLLNLILHNDERMKGRKFRGIAFASPPVYVPLSNVSNEAQTCVNYVNQYDAVPFLSGDTVRHQMAMLAAVESAGLDLAERAELLLGMKQPDTGLVRAIHDIQREPLPVAKEGCPRGMGIPVAGNVWIWPDDDSSADTTFRARITDSVKMSETGIFIHKNDFTDHLPARYEYVLDHLKK